jgi:histone H3/H4
LLRIAEAGENLPELPLAAMERIIKKAGGARVSKSAALELASILEEYITELTKEAMKLTEHRRARTISESDVETAASRFEFKP